MTYPLREQAVCAPHRLFQPMLDFQTMSSALQIAFELMRFGPQIFAGRGSGDWMQTVSTPYPNRAVRLSSYAPMAAIAAGQPLIGLRISVTETLSDPADQAFPSNSGIPFHAAMLRILIQTFTTFYERWRPHIEAKFGDDINRWPGIFAFARRLRDFLVHSNGLVSFRSANAAAVTWYAVTFAPKDNGRDIMAHDLGVADVLILMFEMDDEMTALGFPTA